MFKCLNCKKDSHLLIKVDFQAKVVLEVICVKINQKPSNKRKFGVKASGCGFISSKMVYNQKLEIYPILPPSIN